MVRLSNHELTVANEPSSALREPQGEREPSRTLRPTDRSSGPLSPRPACVRPTPWHNGAVRITKLEWRGIRVPLREVPERTAVPDRHALLVWIHTDDGLVGVGEASPVGPGRPEHTGDVARVLHDLAPSALGLPPSVALGVLLALAPRTEAGDAARFGLETAALDLVGKRCGRPIVTLLGGVIDWVGMHANVGFEEPAEAARQAAEAIARGFGAVKITLGSHDPDVDVEVVRQVRGAVGPKRKPRLGYTGVRSVADSALPLFVLS